MFSRRCSQRIHLAIFLAGSILLGLRGTTQGQVSQWNGATSTDVTTDSNYTGGTAPTFGGNIAAGLYVVNSTNNAFTYTAAQGTSTFSGYTYIGQGNSTGNATVTGGTLSFGSTSNTGSLNQNVIGLGAGTGAGVLNVSGGTVNFLAGNFAGSNTSLWLGNNANGTINLSGGKITTQNGLLLSRDGGNATLNITGGLFQVQGNAGTSWRANGGAGVSTINLSGTNLGVFEQTASATFATGINFQFGYLTGGQFRLASGSNPYDSLAAAGDLSYQATSGGSYLQLDNVPAHSNYYLNYLAVTSANGEYDLSVATVPEPATWTAGVLCAMAMCGHLRRRWRRKSQPNS